MDNLQHQPATSFEILDATNSFAHNARNHYYRILTASRHIKYLAFHILNPGLPDFRGEQLNIETVPEGDWVIGYLAPEEGTNKLVLESTSKVPLASIDQTWYPRIIDWLELSDASSDGNELQRYGKTRAKLCDGYSGADQIFVHYEWDPEIIYPIDHFTHIFSLIDGHSIGPRFLAHVTENHNRVIGCMVEKINGRYATAADLEPCRVVLSKLHSLGILYGSSLSAKEFIITEDNRAVLHGFGTCRECNDLELLGAEMASLEEILGQEVHDPESLNKELGDQCMAMLERDGGLHPEAALQAQKEGRITITESEHKEMLAQLKRDCVFQETGIYMKKNQGTS